MQRALLAACFLLLACPAIAADHLVKVHSRPNASISYWMMERPGAKAT
jgi:hypothetical protein